jgi:NADH dehydrogenase
VILPELGEPLGLYAQKKLSDRQVELKLGARVMAYAEGAIHCSDGDVIPAETLVWAAGVSPSPILKDLPCELEKGRIVVTSTLEVPGARDVWAVGDCASIVDPTSNVPYPPTAQHAIRAGRRAAKNICARQNGTAGRRGADQEHSSAEAV